MYKYTINHNSFSNLTPESLYWLGFIVADGYVKSDRDNTNRIKLELQLKDLNHINKFIKFTGSNKNPDIFYRHKNKRPHYVARVEIFSKQIIEDLYKLGIKSPKRKIKIDDKLINSKDFWRGYIDGDGCWTLNKTKNGIYHRLSLCSCNKHILETFKTFISKFLQKEIKTLIRLVKDQNKFVFNINSNSAKEIAICFYYKNCIALDRKLEYIGNFYAN